MSSSASTASAFSIFAITCAVRSLLLDQRLQVAHVGGGAHERQRDEVACRARARTPGPRGPCASATESGSARPGRFTPLCEVTSPPTTTPQRARPASTSSTRSRIIPSLISTSCPGLSTSPIAAGAIGSSPLRAAPSPTHDRRPRRPASRSSGSSRPPTRNFGPCRSPISASGRPTSSWTSRTSLARARVILVRAVGEVEARRVHPRIDERAQRLRRRAGRADRRNDLRPARRDGWHAPQGSAGPCQRSARGNACHPG